MRRAGATWLASAALLLLAPSLAGADAEPETAPPRGGEHGAHAGHGDHAGHGEHAGHGDHAGRGDHAGHGDHAGRGDHAGHGANAGVDPAPLPPGSIYPLESPWTTAEGREIRLAELGGRVQVLAMVYTHCEHACPRIIGDMRRIRREIGDAGGRVGFVLASLDPARDDAARLRAFAEQTGLAEGWLLLRAPEGSVRELAAALGIRYRRISPEDFLHSNLISVLDSDGVVVHRQVGLGVDPAATVAVIRSMLDAEPGAGEAGAGAP